ncbi:pinin ue [Schizosaccharomyces octosporus yFS286]|uniref:Pinin ue n=1 Tax=Schizosaccharomyces octosporus (strain yFS286) TaxID=483514 RepID=S9PZ99_SCHOY|nr:pinin ue [Schizosaccharomyces octosporus yFS286]EPX73297.1 pinin ue [Schizosaccharomyces octosporus yFS286]
MNEQEENYMKEDHLTKENRPDQDDDSMEIEKTEGSTAHRDQNGKQHSLEGKEPVENKRGKRMFGALLGTLGKFQKEAERERQSQTRSRRAELEEKLAKRQQEEKKEFELQEAKEREQREKELTEERKIVMDDIDLDLKDLKQTLRKQESTFLKTDTEPHLYYRPYYLLPSQKAYLDQVKEEKD